MYIARCICTVRFSEKEVIDWLVECESISEEDAEDYVPTREEVEEYALGLVEDDMGEYEDLRVE